MHYLLVSTLVGLGIMSFGIPVCRAICRDLARMARRDRDPDD